MWTILKTILFKISLVHLFFLILVVTTVTNQNVEQPTDLTYTQTDEKITNAAVGKSSIPLNVDDVSKNNDGESKNYLKEAMKRMSAKNTIFQTNENKNNIDPKENGILGTSSVPQNSENLKPEDNIIETTDDQDIKETNNKNQKSKIIQQDFNDDNLEKGAELKTIDGTSATVDSTKTQMITDVEKNPPENRYVLGMPQKQKHGIEGNPEDDNQKVTGEIITTMNTGNNNYQSNENEKNQIEQDDENIIGGGTSEGLEIAQLK